MLFWLLFDMNLEEKHKVKNSVNIPAWRLKLIITATLEVEIGKAPVQVRPAGTKSS
jgi:hypothetical protein